MPSRPNPEEGSPIGMMLNASCAQEHHNNDDDYNYNDNYNYNNCGNLLPNIYHVSTNTYSGPVTNVCNPRPGYNVCGQYVLTVGGVMYYQVCFIFFLVCMRCVRVFTAHVSAPLCPRSIPTCKASR
jgi:hypothetical protein